MKGLLLRAAAQLAAALRDTAGILLTLLVAALVFALFTEAGARLVLREVESRVGYVHAQGVEGRLWGPIRFDRFEYEDDYVRVELAGAELDWSPLQALLANIAVSRLTAADLTVTVKPARSTPPAPDTADSGAITQLPVSLDIRELAVDRFDLRVDGLEPMRFERVAVAGSWRGDTVRLAPLAAVTPWVGAVRVSGQARLLPDAVQIAGLDITELADAQLHGRLGYGTPSDLTLSWSRLQWPPSGSAQVASDGGELRWRGTFDDWRYRLAAAAQLDGERLQVTADGRGSLAAVEAERVHVDSGHGAVDATAQLSWRPQLTATAQGQLTGLQPQHWLPQLSGELNGRYRVDANFGTDTPEARFTLTLDQSRLNGYPLTLDASGRYAENAVTVQRLDLRSGPSRLQGSGALWPRLSADVQLDSRNLASLWPALSGSLRGRLRASGDWPLPHLTGMLRSTRLRYDALAVESASASFDVDASAESRVDVQLQQLVAGIDVRSAQLSLRGSTARHRLTVDVDLPQGHATATADGALDPSSAHWRGTLTTARLAPDRFPAWDLEEAAALDVNGAVVELEPACFASEIARACAALRPRDDLRRAAFRLERFRLAALDPWLPGGVRAEGALDGNGFVDFGNGALHDLRLELHSGAAQLARNGLPPLRLGPANIVVREQDESLLADADVPFVEGGVHVQARLEPGEDFMRRPLSGELRAELPDLSWIQVFNYEFSQVHGRIDGHIDLGGTLSTPQFDGRIALADGGMRLRTPGITLEQIAATVSGDARSALNVQGSATSGGGSIEFDGRLDPWTQGEATVLKLSGTGFQALHTRDARVWISPKLELSFSGTEVHVDGSIDVPRAEITPKSVDQGVGPSADQIIVREGSEADEPARLGVFADLQLRLGDAVRFDGFGLKSKLGGAVRVSEAPGVPTRARGELQLLEGRYKAYGQDLSIETGRLLFTGGPLTSPAVELKATRTPRSDITVGVLVRGTLDQPEFSLFSTPAMPQERQLSWLVLGRALDESTSSASDRAMVADAALSLGFVGSEWLAARLSGKLGLDEVSIGAKAGESSDQARLTIGKYLSPKLFISYGVSLFQPGHSFRMQYDIGRGFKLATEAGAESGGDLLYTIER